MKHSFKLSALTVLITVALFNNSHAQDVAAITKVQTSWPNNNSGVKEINSIETDFEANSLVTAKFSALFPTATSQKWTGGVDNCWVSFINSGRKVKASFTLEGKLNYAITDCAIQHLPATFSKIITDSYASYQLFNAIEITAHGTVAYQAILENSKGYITLKYTSEGVEEIQQVKKL